MIDGSFPGPDQQLSNFKRRISNRFCFNVNPPEKEHIGEWNRWVMNSHVAYKLNDTCFLSVPPAILYLFITRRQRPLFHCWAGLCDAPPALLTRGSYKKRCVGRVHHHSSSLCHSVGSLRSTIFKSTWRWDSQIKFVQLTTNMAWELFWTEFSSKRQIIKCSSLTSDSLS